MTMLWQDIRLGFRMIARNPGFTTVVVLILAVGIGANTAVFSVVNAVVLRPLPYKDPRGIAALWWQTKDGERRPYHQDFLAWRQQSRVFESLAGYGRQRFYVTGIDRPREIWIDAVSSDLFPLLGAMPLLGRTFAPDEERRGNERVAVLSHAFWRSDFGGTPEAIGRTMNLDGKSYTIIGVMSPRFEWPFAQPSPFWVPLAVLAFTLGTSVLTGLLFGVIPAWRASDVRMSQALKEGWGRSGTGRGWRRVHDGLVVSQIGLSLILLVGATLLVRSLIALQRLDLGFRPENVLAVEIRLPQAKYPEPEHCTAFYDELLLRVRALPDVRSAALVMGDLQLGAMDMDLSFSVPGHPPANPEELPQAKWINASPTFFETMGIRLLRGRTLTDEDDSSVAIVDEYLARKYFPDTDPMIALRYE